MVVVVEAGTCCAKWRVIINIELCKTICVLFSLIVLIRNGMRKTKIFNSYYWQKEDEMSFYIYGICNSIVCIA